MKAETRFIYDWLAAHVAFYGVTEIALVKHVVTDDQEFGRDVTCADFYAIGKRYSVTLRFRSHVPIPVGHSLRALIELGDRLGVKHGIDDTTIVLYLGVRSPREVLWEQT